jgi:arsenate reductase
MAEVLLNHVGGARFEAFSAGSRPTGRVNPLTLKVLEAHHHPTDGLRSKSWDEFARAGMPPMDFVFTVCDSAAQEECPVWPGQPLSAHWSVADPATVIGDEETRTGAFVQTYRELDRRIRLFTALPIESLDRDSLKRKLEEIGPTRLGANELSRSAGR